MTTTRDWLLDPANARPTALASVPRSDLREALRDAPAVARELLRGADPADAADAPLVYRSVSSALARAVLDRDDDLFAAGIESALGIYRIGDFKVGLLTTPPPFEASLWEQLVIELLAVGGLAVTEQAWRFVRSLGLQQPDPDNDYYLSWLRHGQVHSSRGSTDPLDSLPHLAARRLGELHGSLSQADALSAVCRLDLVVALLVIEARAARAGEDARRDWYPSAAVCSEGLVEPLVIDGLRRRDSEAREVVFPNDNAGLREALRAYNEAAVAEAAYSRARGLAWEWQGFSDHRTWSFIRGGELWEEWP